MPSACVGLTYALETRRRDRRRAILEWIDRTRIFATLNGEDGGAQLHRLGLSQQAFAQVKRHFSPRALTRSFTF